MATATAPSTALTIVDRVEQSPVVRMLDDRASALMELLPDQAAADRFRRVSVQAIVKNPDLLECTPESVILSIFEAAAQGLEPTGAAGGAHLVPYRVNAGTKDSPRWEKRAQLIPDYRGVIRLVTKPPSDVQSLEARVVKEGDEFTYELGLAPVVHHVPSLAPDRSAKATTHVYAIARLRDGSTIPDVEDRAGIERVRGKGSKRGFSPWDSDWDEMAKKTIIKRLAKVLPVRPEIRSILVREDELAGVVEGEASAPVVTGPTRASQLARRLQPATDAPGDAGDPPQLPESADEATTAPDPQDAATDAVWTDLEEPGVVDGAPALTELSREALKGLLTQHGIPNTALAETARELFPDAAGMAALTDADRARLWLELERRAAA